MEPTLHLTCGLPGSGKTTVARRLAGERDTHRFSKDEWVLALGGICTTTTCATASKRS